MRLGILNGHSTWSTIRSLMRCEPMRIGVAAGIVMLALATVNVQSTAQSRVTCDRSCLIGFLDRYVDALVARDPSRLPLARTVKFTENGQRLDLGDGLWHTVTGKGGYRLD